MKENPNIVFVLTDDQSYGDLGCTGNPVIQTPNIDEFYTESVRLTNFHVGPTCAPTRAGLMTGHYANSTGVWHTVGGRSLLRRNEWTLPTALKENGYKTGIFGKWHLGDSYPYRPIDRGFDTAIVHGGGGISQTPDYWGNDYFDDTYYVNGKPKAFKGYCTDVFFSEAINYIEQNKDTPFFCYIACNAPHSPFNVEPKYSAPYTQKTTEQRARFYGMVTNIDENFGKLRKKLEELNLTDNTILIFMTDNGTAGGATIDKQGFLVSGYNGGLRGSKNSEYDGGHRVPFFIQYNDGNINGGRNVDELTANVDFMPTLLDLCNIPTKESVDFHGDSLRTLLEGDTKWNDRIMVTDSQRLAYPMKWRKSCVMTKDWRLINGQELYNVQEDREQRKDVSSQHKKLVTKLRNGYEAWWEIVSQQYDETIPISIGAEATEITNHDLRNEECDTAWNQKMIREGYCTAGYWEIDVEEEGEYEIQLRRWHKSSDRPIQQGIEGDDIAFNREGIGQEDWEFYTGGKALEIQNVHVCIQGQQHSKAVNEKEAFAKFSVRLKKGQTRLEAWFSNAQEQFITSAYFIDIKKCS